MSYTISVFFLYTSHPRGFWTTMKMSCGRSRVFYRKPYFRSRRVKRGTKITRSIKRGGGVKRVFSRRRRRREIGSDPGTDHGRFGRYTSIYVSTARIKQKTYTHTHTTALFRYVVIFILEICFHQQYMRRDEINNYALNSSKYIMILSRLKILFIFNNHIIRNDD